MARFRTIWMCLVAALLAPPHAHGEPDEQPPAAAAPLGRAERLHELLHGTPERRLAAATAYSQPTVLSRQELDALVQVASSSLTPPLARLAARSLAGAGPHWHAGVEALNKLSKDAKRSTWLASEFGQVRSLLDEARRREAIRQQLLAALRGQPRIHCALVWTKSVASQPDVQRFTEFARDGDRWGVRMWSTGDSGDDTWGLVGTSHMILGVREGLAAFKKMACPRLDLDVEPMSAMRSAARKALGFARDSSVPSFGVRQPPCFMLEVGIAEDPSKVAMSVGVGATAIDDGGPTPSWLAAPEFHAHGVRVERRGDAIAWSREREERVFDATDGMPRSWSLAGETARLEGRSTPPARPFDSWQRGLDATEELWSESPHQAVYLDWTRQTYAFDLVQSANLRLAIEADWLVRRTNVARDVATAYCATDAIRGRTRAAAATVAKGGSAPLTLTDVTLETAVESILGEIVAPLFTPEKPPGYELAPAPDDEVLRELRMELLLAIRTALEDQIRDAWPK